MTIDEVTVMNMTKRKPVSAGEMITEEFLQPLSITRRQLAEAMGASKETVDELCNNLRPVSTDIALILAKVLGNTPEFWLNLQQRNELWIALHTPKRLARIKQAKPLIAAMPA